MVVGVVGLACRAAEQRRLFLRLPDLGSREQATRWNPVLDEGRVVRPPAELRWHERRVSRPVKLLEVPLQLGGPERARQVEGVAVAVVDAIDVVGAGDLVEGK